MISKQVDHQLHRIVAERSWAVVHKFDNELKIGHHRAALLLILILGGLIIRSFKLEDLKNQANLLNDDSHIEFLHQLSISIWVPEYDNNTL